MTGPLNHRCAVCRVVIQRHLRLCAACDANSTKPADPFTPPETTIITPMTHVPHAPEPVLLNPPPVTVDPLPEPASVQTYDPITEQYSDPAAVCPHGRFWLEDCVQCGRVVAVEPQPEEQKQQ